jgi:hypothetical protein
MAAPYYYFFQFPVEYSALSRYWHLDNTEPVYNACYEWRKIAHISELWSQLPNEMIEMIARSCIVRQRIEYQPSGTVNYSTMRESYRKYRLVS